MPKSKHSHEKKIKFKKKSRTTIAFLTYAVYKDPNSFSLWSGIYDMARENELNLICLPANPPDSPVGFEAKANVLYNMVNKKNIDGLIIWGAGLAIYADPLVVKNKIYDRFKYFPKVSIGIDNKYFDQIFNPFQRLHGLTEYSGTGIGLAICKKIVEMHKGKIRVESILGKGTKFIVTLPIK